MPRNSQGLYTLPLPPVVPNTLIETTWANPTMDDIASALTASLPRDGSAPMIGPLTLDGGAPTQARHAVDKAYVDSFMAYASGLPIGAVVSYAANSAPPGFLLCDGSAVSRTTYSDLFAAIGTTYGAGDSVSTFNIPDLRDEFVRGKGAARALGSKQAATLAAHTHVLSDPGHTHAATQVAHSHTISTGGHNHSINDPGHAHGEGFGVPQAVGADGSAPGGAWQKSTGSNTTGISLGAVGDLGGSADSQQPAIAVPSSVTGAAIGATGDVETRPQNIALDYYIKAVNDSTNTGIITGIDTSDANMISVDNTNLAVPKLVIHSNVSFGTVKLDASGKVPLNQMPFLEQRFLGFFDASGDQTPSEANPSTTYYSGDSYVISDGGTLLVYDPVTLIASSVAVTAGNELTYVSNSTTNPTGWYYVASPGMVIASDVEFIPAGGISATNVQAALTELGTEKLDKAGDTMTGALAINVNDAGAALTVNQSGAGNVALFEDSANPDSTPVVINTDGKLIVGATSSYSSAPVQSTSGGVNFGARVATDTANAPTYGTHRSRGTIDAPTAVQNNDIIGQLRLYGYSDTANYYEVVSIVGTVDGVPASGQIPGRLVFSTTPVGGSATVERLRINNAGALGLNGANFGSSGQTLVSQGSSAPPIWGNPQAGRTISANDANPGLLITQAGTGNALVVEDEANPDSTPFVINSTGLVVAGHTTTIPTVSSLVPSISSIITGTSQVGYSTNRFQDDNTDAKFAFNKARGTVSAPAVVASGDGLGKIWFAGYDGAAYQRGATIEAGVDGTPGTNDMPGRLIFSTTGDGFVTPAERMRIDSVGNVGIGGAAPAGQRLRIAGSISGATTAYAFQANATIQSDVTNTVVGNGQIFGTVAASFICTNIFYNNASQGTFGAGSTVTNQFGFRADSTLVGATNNYGFASLIPAGTNRWNFYASGTAPNYFAGITTFGTDVQLGNHATATNNFTLDAGNTNGTMKLARGNAGATTQDIMTVDATGKVAFPAMGQSLAANGYAKLPGGLIIQWGTNAVVVNAGGDGDIDYPVAFNSLFTILVSDGDGVTNLGVVNSSILSKFTFRSQTPSVAIRCNWIAVGI